MEHIIKGIIHDRVILTGKKTPLVPDFISQRQYSDSLRFTGPAEKAQREKQGGSPFLQCCLMFLLPNMSKCWQSEIHVLQVIQLIIFKTFSPSCVLGFL